MSSMLRTLFTHTVSRHKKLSEDAGEGELVKEEGLTFCCKYLGSSLVADAKGETGTAQAIAHIIAKAKHSGQKPLKVNLKVSIEGIQVCHSESLKEMLTVSIYKISYCSADAHYDHVFAFIATNQDEELECHAFLCAKKKIAQDVTMSIAQCFKLAYQYWKNKIKTEDDDHSDVNNEMNIKLQSNEIPSAISSIKFGSDFDSCEESTSPAHNYSEFGSSELNSSGYSSAAAPPRPLIDFEDSINEESSTLLPCYLDNVKKKWAQFDDNAEGGFEFEDKFSRLKLKSSDPGSQWNNDLAVFKLDSLNSPPKSKTKSLFPEHIKDLKSSNSLPTNNLSLDLFNEPVTFEQINPTKNCSNPMQVNSGQQQNICSPVDDDSTWISFGNSPNSNFLNGCQSPTFLQHPAPILPIQNNFENKSNLISGLDSLFANPISPSFNAIDKNTSSSNLFSFSNNEIKTQNNDIKPHPNNDSSSRSKWLNFPDENSSSNDLESSRINRNPFCGINQSSWSDNLDKIKGNNLICS